MIGPIRPYLSAPSFGEKPMTCVKCSYHPSTEETDEGFGLNVEGLCIDHARPVCPLCIDFKDALIDYDQGQACEHCVKQCQECIKPATKWTAIAPEEAEDIGATTIEGKVGRCEYHWRKKFKLLTRSELIEAGEEVPELFPDTPITF